MATMMQIGQRVLGRYQIVDLIQEGGQASVAKGVEKRSGAFVAIRQLSASPGQPQYAEELARFQRAAALRIGHPAVVDPVDAGEDGGERYMVSPFIDGVDLQTYVARQGGKLPPDQALSILCELAGGVAASHAKGVIHRDLKPANLLIDPEGHCHILDFGICRAVQEATITQGSGLLGSLQWMSPEQIISPGCEDARTDLYALGTVFYFMVTGQVPAQGDDPGQIALSICQRMPSSPRQLDASIPPQVDQICMRLLAKHPDDRFQSGEELLGAISTSGQPTGGRGFCMSCGTQMQPDARYCHSCGAQKDTSSMAAVYCLACGGITAQTSACPACHRPFGQVSHRLQFRSGSLTGKTFRIPEGIYDVGREQLEPRDQHISRRQLRVACSNGSVHVEDAGSTNKTSVDRRPADRPVLLKVSQELWLAGSSAVYDIQ
jgi:serine/threonine protein kinase